MRNAIIIFCAEYLHIIVIVIVFVWFLKQPRKRQKEILLFACICLPLIYIAAKIASSVYYNPRPFVSENFKPIIPHKANNGFPSSHTLLVSAVSAVIFIFNRRLSLVLWVLALAVGISRVCAGVHHLLDIAGSVVISVAVVYLVNLGMKIIRHK